MALEPGSSLGSYRIESELGRGGMATVYKAYQPSLARNVAIKVLPEYFAHEPGFLERFQQEAIAVANLRHPNIPVVHDYGEQAGITYIVSEYIDGGTLTDHLGKPLPAGDVIKLLRPVAAALDHAHAKGVLHRDVKPSNVLLERDGTPMLADFGLAKMLSSDQTSLTRTGTILGTPAYMAPEQCEGQELTPAVDVYALGVVAYEMLTGRQPFVGTTPIAVMLAQVKDPLPPPHTLNPDIAQRVEDVLLKALAKHPADRYASCTAFIDDLAVALEPEPVPIVAQPVAPKRPRFSFPRPRPRVATAAVPVVAPPPPAVAEEPAELAEPAAPAQPPVPKRPPVRLPRVSRGVAAVAGLVLLLAVIGGGAGLAYVLQPPSPQLTASHSPSPAAQASPSHSPAVLASPSPSPSTANGTKTPAASISARFTGAGPSGGFAYIVTGAHFTPGQTGSLDFFDPPNSGTFYPRWTATIRADGTVTWSTFVGGTGNGKFTGCDSSHHCASVLVTLGS